VLPKSISPSSLLTFEGCPARFMAESVLARAEDIHFHSGPPAKLGTACHGALDAFVKSGLHTDPNAKFSSLEAMFVKEYYAAFDNPDWYEVGIKCLENWWNRKDFSDRVVISTEEKKTFNVPVTMPDGTQGFLKLNYIMDRMDKWTDKNVVEVIDYKTIVRPIGPDELKNKIQARVYALAAQIDYPDIDLIWVTFDMLRYQPVSVSFTRDDNIETWNYLKSVAQRIVDSDGTEEIINDQCRWCIRKANCRTLNMFHKITGPPLDPADFDGLLKYRYQAKGAMDALKEQLGHTDELIATWMEENDLVEAESDFYTVKIRTRSERRVDEDRVAQIIGKDLVAKYGKIGVKELEKILEDGKITDAQRSQLKQLVRKDVTSSWVEAKPKVEADVEDL
jgi:predicted DNA-binding WGR domain protein